jgi:hypothetical protein
MKSQETAGWTDGGGTMSVGIKADFAKENIMRRLRNSILGVLVLAAMAVALAPKAVLADDDGAPIKGTFAVSAMFPSALNYCPSGGNPIEAQGIGNISKLGPLFLTVKKCGTLHGSVITLQGPFKMTAANGDTLEGTETGTLDLSLKDENGYIPSQGTFTFVGGTGRFSHANGVLSWTAVQSPTSVGVNGGTVNLTVFLLVQGNMSLPDND